MKQLSHESEARDTQNSEEHSISNMPKQDDMPMNFHRFTVVTRIYTNSQKSKQINHTVSLGKILIKTCEFKDTNSM